MEFYSVVWFFHFASYSDLLLYGLSRLRASQLNELGNLTSLHHHLKEVFQIQCQLHRLKVCVVKTKLFKLKLGTYVWMQSKPKSLIIKIKTEGEIFVFAVEELDTVVTHTYYCWKRIVLINSYYFIFSRWQRRGTKWWHKGHVFAICRNLHSESIQYSLNPFPHT